jgi:hypothetical protein
MLTVSVASSFGACFRGAPDEFIEPAVPDEEVSELSLSERY